MGFLRRGVERLRGYDDVVEIGEIARRYFAMNGFDGILTIIGVLMGNLTAGVDDARVVISTGLATSISMGISGLWGAYMTESAERRRSLNDLENHTLSDLRNTRIGRASRVAVIIVALVDGLSPLLASVVVLIPMFIAGMVGGVQMGYYLSLGLSLVALFSLGVYLGVIGRQNLLLAGIKMIGAGIVAILVSYALKIVG